MDRQRTCEYVGGATGRNRYDNANGPARITLRGGRGGSSHQKNGKPETAKYGHGEIVICNAGDSR